MEKERGSSQRGLSGGANFVEPKLTERLLRWAFVKAPCRSFASKSFLPPASRAPTHVYLSAAAPTLTISLPILISVVGVSQEAPEVCIHAATLPNFSRATNTCTQFMEQNKKTQRRKLGKGCELTLLNGSRAITKFIH